MYLSPATCSKGKSSRLGDFLGSGEERGDKIERAKQNQEKKTNMFVTIFTKAVIILQILVLHPKQ